jgi:ATP-dependent phosphoenolpyruvate carboxykinase
MPEALSFIEIDRQHLELLPARTVMSMFMPASEGGGGGTAGASGNTNTGGTTSTADPNQQLAGIMQMVGQMPLVGKMLFPK